MYCKNCGYQFETGQFCPKCGTKHTMSVSLDKKKHDFLNHKLGVLLAFALCILIFVGCIVVRCTLNSGHHAVKQFYNAVEKQNVSSMLSCVPDDFLKDLEDDYYVSRKEIKKALERYLDDEWISDWVYSSYDPGDEIEFTYEDEDEMNDREVKSIKSSLREVGSLSINKFEPKKVKKGEMIEIEFDVRGEETRTISTFKYEGDWYSWNALALVEHATRLYA